MSAVARLVLALALFAGGFAGGIKWHAGIVAERELQAQELRREKARNDRKAVDVAASGHEKDKVQIRTEFLTITEEVERVVEKPFYVASEQCLDDDGLRQLATAIGPRGAASEPARAVPGSGAPSWWKPRANAQVEH